MSGKAIILQGPPCVGKSVIRDVLLSRLPPPNSRFINLDAYWTPGEVRYIGWPHPYADIQLATEHVLIMELASGEPPDLAKNGAVRGAREWIDVLDRAQRDVFFFRLSMDWDPYIQRLIERHQGNPQTLYAVMSQVGLYALYEHNHPLVTISHHNLVQHPLNTTNRTPQELADEIAHVAGL